MSECVTGLVLERLAPLRNIIMSKFGEREKSFRPGSGIYVK